MGKARTDEDDLNERQAAFCVEYLKDLNGTKAAIRAGYAPASAGAQASELLNHPNIAAKIDELQARRVSAADATAESVLREFMRLASFDSREMFDEFGNLKPPQQWTVEQGASVSSFEVIIKNAKAGDGETDTIHKVRLYDKTKALDSLAKNLGLLIDRVDLNVRGDGEFIARLQSARAKVAKEGP